jgi:hypothetical protein
MNLRKITWADSLFVAGGDAGALIASPDGVMWTDHSLGTSQYVSDIAFGAGKFVLFTGDDFIDRTGEVLQQRLYLRRRYNVDQRSFEDRQGVSKVDMG